MKFLQKIFQPTSISACLMVASLAVIAKDAKSQTLSACPASGIEDFSPNYTDGCYGTPDVYGVTFFEMGLCTADPMASGTFDRSTCTATFKDSGGLYKNIAGATVTLGAGTGEKPANGEYSYAYGLLSNVFTIKGSYTTTGGTGATYYTISDFVSGTSNVNTTGPAVEIEDTLTSFGSSCTTKGSETFGNGSMTAYVLDSSLSVATGCTGVSKLLGYMTLNSPIEITDNTAGLQMTFKVTNSGMTVSPNSGATTQVAALGNGPFSVQFTVFE